MIFNFDFVIISSPSGLHYWGEFSEVDKMISELERLRKNNEILTLNSSVLMAGYVRKKSGETKRITVYELANFDGQWVLCFNIPKK